MDVAHDVRRKIPKGDVWVLSPREVKGDTSGKGVDCYDWGDCAGVEGSRVGCGAGDGVGCVREDDGERVCENGELFGTTAS